MMTAEKKGTIRIVGTRAGILLRARSAGNKIVEVFFLVGFDLADIFMVMSFFLGQGIFRFGSIRKMPGTCWLAFRRVQCDYLGMHFFDVF